MLLFLLVYNTSVYNTSVYKKCAYLKPSEQKEIEQAEKHLPFVNAHLKPCPVE